MFIDYYELLEISPNANSETIERIFRYFALRYHPDNSDTGDLSRYHDVVVERTLEVGKELVQQGAQAIIPLGGKIYPYVVQPEELEPELGVPVINTKAVGVSYAELMARNKIQHSLRAYPCPTGLNPEAVSQRSK